MFGETKPFPPYLQGFGQDDTVQDWIKTVFQPIADVAQEYYNIQTQQEQTQWASSSSILPSIKGISSIYLIGIGFLAWYLLRKKR